MLTVSAAAVLVTTMAWRPIAWLLWNTTGSVPVGLYRVERRCWAGIVERTDADRWRIPADFEARAAEYDASRGASARVRVLSAFDLDQQVTSDGAPWLDRHIVNPNRVRLPAEHLVLRSSKPCSGARTNWFGEVRAGEPLRASSVREPT